MVVSNRNLLFQRSIFRCYVNFREGSYIYSNPLPAPLFSFRIDFTLPHKKSDHPVGKYQPFERSVFNTQSFSSSFLWGLCTKKPGGERVQNQAKMCRLKPEIRLLKFAPCYEGILDTPKVGLFSYRFITGDGLLKGLGLFFFQSNYRSWWYLSHTKNPLYWLVNKVPFKWLLKKIPTQLGRTSSPIYTKQQGVFLLCSSGYTPLPLPQSPRNPLSRF